MSAAILEFPVSKKMVRRLKSVARLKYIEEMMNNKQYYRPLQFDAIDASLFCEEMTYE